MLWIAIAFVVAMMVGFLIPRQPLKLDLKGAPKLPASPSQSPASAASPPAKATDDLES